MIRKLNKIFDKSEVMEINDKSKIVIMSDCHRGTGDNFDNFLKNRNVYRAALSYYFRNDFTYIELGDGDELWEVDNYKEIIDIYLDIFRQLKKFYDEDRLIMIYGNHDIIKRDDEVLKKYFYNYYNESTNHYEKLLDGLKVYESLVLKYKNEDIFMLHGHQVDFLNGTLWRFSRFLVRNVWHYLEFLGINDPTSAAKNNYVSNLVEKKLQKWSFKNNKIIIAGHTHRPLFPKVGQSMYFNDGSCIHPNGITCLEISNGKITLVKWELNVKEDGLLYVERFLMSSEEPIINFFNTD